MAHRVHLAAHLTRTGPDPDLCHAREAFTLDGWAGATLSVWGASTVDLDWRLARISRRHATLALRATTEDDYLFQLVVLINGERAVRLSHVFFAGPDEALEMLRDSLGLDQLPADRPVDPARRQEVADLAGEERSQPWLLRVVAGESPSEAFLNAGRLQAMEVAAVAEAAGLACDVERLERFFTGSLTPAEVEAEAEWQHFGDLLLFVEALGLHGIKQHLEAEAKLDQQAAGGEVEEEKDVGGEKPLEEQEGRRRTFGKRLAATGCLLSSVAVAAMVWFGAELAGGWGAAGAILVFVLLMAIAGRWLWRRFVGRLKQTFGGDSLAAEAEVPPAVLNKWRTLLFNWRDLVFRLGEAGSMKGRRPKVGIFDALYSDVGLPTDPAGRRLTELLTANPTIMPELAAEVRALRLALLDAEIAGTDAGPQRAAYGTLCEQLLATE